MVLTYRCVVVAAAIVGILVLANAWGIVAWLDALGLIGLARWIHAEFVTGTAVTVIAAMVFLNMPTSWNRGARCRVCEQPIRRVRYCPKCGSRVGPC